MTRTEMSAKPSGSLSKQLTRRVLLLSLIGVAGLISTLVLSLLLTLQQVQNRMDKVNVEATKKFDLFFLNIQSDLLSTSDSLATRDDVELTLLQLQARNSSFLDVLLVNFDGEIINQRNVVGRPRQTKIQERSWLESPPPFGEVFIGPAGFEGQAPYVDMAVTATDDIGLSSGLLWVRVDLTGLWNTTLDVQVGATGYAYITDESGQLVAYRNRRLLESGNNLADLVGRTPQAIARSRLSWYTGLNEQLVLASARPLKVVPWFAIVEQPIAEALSPFLIPAAILLIVLALLGLLLYSTVRFTRARIVSPLLALSEVVGQMRGGQLDPRTEIRHNDELGQLARSFNSMASQLQEAFKALEGQVVKLKRAEEALREEKAFTEAALDSQRDTFFVFDPTNGKAVRWNRAFGEISGYSDAEIAGMKAPDAWYSTEDLKRAAAATEKIRQEGQATIEMSLLTKDKRAVPFEYVASSVMNIEGAPQYIIAIGRDIAERKRIEAELTRYREHLEELVDARTADLQRANDGLAREISERVRVEAALQKATDRAKRSAKVAEQARAAAEAANRAKSAFLANMSHELRTPLNAILGFTQLMRRDQAFSPDQRKNLRIIHRSGEHLLELLNDVLEMSKIEAGRATFTESDFDLYKLLDGLESMFVARAQNKGLQLCFERAPDVPQYIRTDERKLRQTLINLLGNAVKFTEQGGVTLRVWTKDQGPRTKDELPRQTVVRHSSLVFEVDDTGAGIAPEERSKIFEAFTQAASGQKALEGTGLGLALSRRFVQLMGGDISVESPSLTSPPMGEPALSLSRGIEGGPGSVFRFDIQVAVADVGAVQERQPARRVVGLAPGQHAYRILVVEDREASRVLLVQLLAAVGFEVRQAVNGQEALEMWRDWNPHLIWMDMRMPVLDGYEATRRIKSQAGAGAPTIIALTAHAFEEERAAILTAGCDGFVRKPFQEDEIFEVMAQHLDVHYVYEEPIQAVEPSDDLIPVALTPADLAVLPADWIADLRQAATRGEAELTLELIERIEAKHAPLTEALAQLVHEFRFDRLVTLTEQ